jgi:hypothetical protein
MCEAPRYVISSAPLLFLCGRLSKLCSPNFRADGDTAAILSSRTIDLQIRTRYKQLVLAASLFNSPDPSKDDVSVPLLRRH